MRAKRIFRWLGTKSHHRDHQILEPSTSSKRTSSTSNNQCFEYLPDYSEILSTVVEMDNHQALCELGDNYKSGLVELNGSIILPAELSGNSISTFELDNSSARSKSSRCPKSDGGTASSPYDPTIDDIQAHALSAPSFNNHDPPSQLHIKSKFKADMPEDSLPLIQSPVSQRGTGWMSTSYTDTMSESPTNTNFSGIPLFTEAFEGEISPPSTRNSTMQSFSQSSPTAQRPLEYLPPLSDIENTINESPSDLSEKEFPCEGLVSTIPVDAFHPAEKRVSTRLDSPQWLTPEGLLNDFWKILTLHVDESLERLQMLLDSPVISGLLSMTVETIAYSGFSAWQRTLKGYLPATIADLYALVHVAYACAVVIFDGQVENQVEGLFAHSLAIETVAMSEEEKSIYMNIVWSIWSPPLADVHLHAFSSAEHNARLPCGQSWAKRYAPLRLIGVSKGVDGSIYLKEVLCAMELHLRRGNEILNVLTHFLDIFEGTNFCAEMPLVNSEQSRGSRDENFIETVKENITIPLMESHFQATPSLEAFIKVVLQIERLVDIGQISSVRELEVSLIWAGRSIAQSIELYEIFSNRVKELRSTVYRRLHQDPALQIDSRFERIDDLLIKLEIVKPESNDSEFDLERQHHGGVLPDVPSLPPKIGSASLYNNIDISAVDNLSQSHVRRGELCRRSAIKRKISSSSSTPETGPSPSSSSSSNTLSDSSESEYNSCPSCGFRPKGERKWHKRTMTRHMLTHLDQDRKEVYLCNYEGCESSFTRADNLAQHVRGVHQRNKRQCKPDVSFGSGGVTTFPESDARSDS